MSLMWHQFRMHVNMNVNTLNIPSCPHIGSIPNQQNALIDCSHLAGAWVGLELDDAQGKNDGVVRGYRYFCCPPNHGFSA